LAVASSGHLDKAKEQHKFVVDTFGTAAHAGSLYFAQLSVAAGGVGLITKEIWLSMSAVAIRG
jgi:hypothetical protein